MDLRKSIVKVEGNKYVGTGFVIRDGGWIITCAHNLGRSRPEKAFVIFEANKIRQEVIVLEEYWRGKEAEDIAILKLLEPLPTGAEPLPLGSSQGIQEHPMWTFGYPDIDAVEGVVGGGTIVGPGGKDKAEQQLLQLRSTEITEGFSGAPVWDKSRNRVVGMVVRAAEVDDMGRQTQTAWATPTEAIRKILPVLHISDICPYRGLNSFTKDDKNLFYGREETIQDLLGYFGKKEKPRFLAIYGASGSGKSSLVQAGLIPRLDEARPDITDIIVTTPKGGSLMQDLEKAKRALVPALLIIDQFEELFEPDQKTQPSDVMATLVWLLEYAPRVTLIIVMRDDFYSMLRRQETLNRWLKDREKYVGKTLSHEQVEDIIRQPAESLGWRFEKGLIEILINDVLATSAKGDSKDENSTILPLLEFTLTKLWEKCQEKDNEPEDGFFTRKAYRKIGGVAQGLSNWAEETYDKFEERLHPLVRRVFTDLVHPGDKEQGIPDSRRRMSLNDLIYNEEEKADVISIIQHFVDARLLVTSQDQKSKQEKVELIHEALLWAWPQLQTWVEMDREFLQWRRGELEYRVKAWDGNKKQDKEQLLRGSDLQKAEDHLQKNQAKLKSLEREFIEASKKRQRGEKQRGILLRIAGVIVVVIITILISLLLINNYTSIRATQIRACMQQHHLNEAHAKLSQVSDVAHGDIAGAVPGSDVTFAQCDWPPLAYEGPDGYSQIQVVTVNGPGQVEADGTNVADRITVPCQKLQLKYTFNAQGIDVHNSSIIANADKIYLSDGTLWKGDPGLLNFYPERGEIVVLHNSRIHIDNAICV